MMENELMKLNPGLPWQEGSFYQHIGFKFGAELYMVLKSGRFGQQIRKHLEGFEMWCWRRMEKISWTDHVRNEEVFTQSPGAEEYLT